MSKRTHDGQRKASTSMFKVPSQIRTRSFRKNSARCLRKPVLKTTQPQSKSESKVKKVPPIKPSPKPVIKTKRKSTVPRKNAVNSENNECAQINEKTSVSTQPKLNKTEGSQRITLKQRCLASHSSRSFAEFIRIKELGEELDDEDLLEIVHCPSPVWWEDPPDESYDEDPIFGREKHAATPSNEQNMGTKQLQPALELTELKIPRIPDSKCDQKFLTKRSTLENVLQNLASKKDASKSAFCADSSTAQHLRMFRKTKSSNSISSDINQTMSLLKSKCNSEESKLKSNRLISEALCEKSKLISNKIKTYFPNGDENKTLININDDVKSDLAPMIQNDARQSETVTKSSNNVETKKTETDLDGNKKIRPPTVLEQKRINEQYTSLILSDGSTTLKKITPTEKLQPEAKCSNTTSPTNLKSNMPVKRVYSGSDSAEIIPNDINSNSDKSNKKTGMVNEVIDLSEETESDANIVAYDILKSKECEILKELQSLKIPIADINDDLIVIEDCHIQIDNVSSCIQNKHSAEQENGKNTHKEISNDVSKTTYDKTEIELKLTDNSRPTTYLLQDTEDEESVEIPLKFPNATRNCLQRKRGNSGSTLSHKPPKILCKDERANTEDSVKECDKSDADPLQKIPTHIIDSTLTKEKNAEKIRSAYNEMLTKIRSRIKSRKDTSIQKDTNNTNKKKIIAQPKNGNQSSTPEIPFQKTVKSVDLVEGFLKPTDIEIHDKTYSTAEKSIIKVPPMQTSISDKQVIKTDKSTDTSVKRLVKSSSVETVAKTHSRTEKPIVKVLSTQIFTPDKQLMKSIKSKDVSVKSLLKSRAVETLAKKHNIAGKSIIKVLPAQMSREMIDEIIGIKNTEAHTNPESLEGVLCPDLAVKKDIIIEHKDNVKYCFKCSSIYNTTECSYCVEPKHTVDDKIVAQKLCSRDFGEYKNIEKSKDIKTANHGQESIHTL